MNSTNENNQSTIATQNDHEEFEHTLEEAIEATKIGKYQILLIAFSGMSILGATAENLCLSLILTYIKCDMKITLTEQGILTSVIFIGFTSSSFFWGLLLDTWGRKKVLCTAALLGFAFSFPSAFAMNTTMFIFLRFLTGVFLSGCTAGPFSYVSEFHTTKTAPRAVAYSSIFPSCVLILMTTLAMQIIPMDFEWEIFSMNFKPWRLFLICNSFINLLNGIIFAFLPETPKFLLAVNRREEALQVLRRVYAFNTGQPEMSYPVKSIKRDSNDNNSLASTKGFFNIIRFFWRQMKPILFPPLLNYTWKFCFLFYVIYSMGFGLFMWFPDFLVQLQNYNGPAKILCNIVTPKTTKEDNGFEMCQTLDNKNITSYKIIFGNGIFFALCAILLSFSLKKLSLKKVMYIWIMISSTCCLALNILTDFNAIVISFVVMISCYNCANITMSVAVNSYPTQYKGMATTIIIMFGRLGGFFGSNFVGFLLLNQCTLIFYVNSALLFSCIFIFATINVNDKSTNK